MPYAVQLDRASNQYLSRADGAEWEITAGLTVAGWVHADSAGTTQYIAGKYAAGAREWVLLRTAANVLEGRLSADGTGNTTHTSSLTIPTGKWTFVVLRYDGTNLDLNVNGSAKRSKAHPGGIHNGNARVTLGASDISLVNSFDGRMDEFGIWGRYLSDAEVTWLFNAAVGRVFAELTAEIKANLIAWYDEEGDDADASGNGLDLTPQNGPLSYVAGVELPTFVENDLPFAGKFFGNPFFGDLISNNKVREEASFRFRAERSGPIASITFNNRYNTGIETGYSEGDGGLVYLDVRTNGANGLPTGTVLGGPTPTYTPTEQPLILTISFDPQPVVEAGKLYHAVQHQIAGDPNRYASTNNPTRGFEIAPVNGPYGGNDWHLFNKVDGAWNPRPLAFPMFTLTYADGVSVGSGYTGASPQERTISGLEQVRQNFLVEGPTQRVDGVWVRAARRSTDGSPLTVTLANGDGTPIEEIIVPEADVSFTPAGMLDAAVNWFYVSFGAIHTLVIGTEYNLRFASSGEYVINCVRSTFGGIDRNVWQNSRAQYSSDGGSTWVQFVETGTEGDLSVLFTLDGGPRSISNIDIPPSSSVLSRLRLSVTLLARLNDQREGFGVGGLAAGLELSPDLPLSPGTEANQADRLIFGLRNSLAGGTVLDVDLFDFTESIADRNEVDQLGNPVQLAEVVALLLRNRAASVGDLHIGGEGTSNAWSAPWDGDNSGKLVLKPGGCLMLFAPTKPAYAVGTGISDYILRLAAVGGNVIYDGVIVGRSEP